MNLKEYERKRSWLTLTCYFDTWLMRQSETSKSLRIIDIPTDFRTGEFPERCTNGLQPQPSYATVDTCEHGNEPMSLIEGGEFLNWPSEILA